MARYRMIGLLFLATASAVLTWALPAAARQSSVRASIVTVTAGKPTEFRFLLSKKIVPHGVVTFKVTNKGGLPHDFKILGKKTRLLTMGQTQSLKVTFLKKGKYAYTCTVSGHAAAGMKGILTVT
jgi:uncharacterized cupredoxin-like copper-binding protein